MSAKNVLLESKLKKAQALAQNGRLDEAAALLDEIRARWRLEPELWMLLGSVNGLRGRHDKAEAALRTAVRLRPNHDQFRYNLGIALRSLGKTEEALEQFRAAFRLNPRHASANDCIVHILLALQRPEEAVAEAEAARGLDGNRGERLSNLSAAYMLLGRLEEAVEAGQKATACRPRPAVAHANLGSALGAQGKHDEALACYREALAANRRDANCHSNLLLTLNYLDNISSETLLKEHRDWEARQATGIRPRTTQRSSCSDRLLRVGYVSADFRTHSVAYFIEPLLQSYDRGRFEVYCYANMPGGDTTTERLKSYPVTWRVIYGVADERVADMIEADGIDLLVDLGGHTAHNRLQVFAHKPAPVQLSYLGYPNTTGLSSIDYRLTDALADPEGEERWYTEKLLRLANCFLCYRPPEHAPPVRDETPAVQNGHVTFGSFNNAAKISPSTIRLWAQVLVAVPESRLLLKNPSFSDAATRARFAGLFADAGVPAERLELLGLVRDPAGHLALYDRVDIALDTVPYNGTTTTCEALWMGVPVLTLAGTRHVGRVGVSLLNAAGLREYVAATAEAFVANAAALASDLDALSALRRRLRAQLQASPLCDEAGFVRSVETTYLKMLHWDDSPSA